MLRLDAANPAVTAEYTTGRNPVDQQIKLTALAVINLRVIEMAFQALKKIGHNAAYAAA